MRRFIRYLYEYEQGRRTRNVGFVKVEQNENACVVHVHGKGLRPGAGSRLWLSLFFREKDGICLLKRREEARANPALNSQIEYTREEFGDEGLFSRICGVVLESDAQKVYLAVWDDALVSLANIRIWERRQETGENAGQEADVSAADLGQTEEIPALEAGQMEENVPIEANEQPEASSLSSNVGSLEEDTAPDECDAVMSEAMRTQRMNMEGNLRRLHTQEECPGEETGKQQKEKITAVRSEGVWINQKESGLKEVQVQNIGSELSKPAWAYRKVQRSQLTFLARCEWRLANNQFLMHGYRNYHHLLLLEREGKLYLGVPGIYHRREAQAAETFGFPEFVGIEEIQIHLSDEEKQPEAFGYWIRPVKRM